MRFAAAAPADGQYCVVCCAEAISRVFDDGLTRYDCAACGVRSDRSLVIDPAVRWWVAEDGEYWHESAGVLLRDDRDRILLYRRTIFPFVLTMPAGHVDTGEDPSATAGRELAEETGVEVDELHPLGVDDIVGDSCRRGSDAHRWHAYAARLPADVPVRIGDEGRDPVWLSPADALAADLAVPVRYVLEKYLRLRGGGG